MRLHVKYFARLREHLACAEEVLDAAQGWTVRDLLKHIAARGEPWASQLRDPVLLVAVNQSMSTLEANLHEGDEVAFFPPVTGG